MQEKKYYNIEKYEKLYLASVSLFKAGTGLCSGQRHPQDGMVKELRREKCSLLQISDQTTKATSNGYHADS